MNQYKKLSLLVAVISLLGAKTLLADWEIISPNPKMSNIEIMGDTWYGMEYKGSTSSIFLSSKNNGHTWDAIPGFTNIFLIRVHKDRILVNGIYNGSLGFYLSTDSARTWKKLTWLYPGSAIDMLLNDSSIIVFASKSTSVTSPLYRSLDDGVTWHPLPIETEDVNWNGNVKHVNLRVRGKTIGAFLNSAGFHYSNDGGSTWTKNIEGLPKDAYGALSILPQGFSVKCYWPASGWYIFNGTSWIKQEYKQDYKHYHYSPENDKWQESTSNFFPFVSACREPYMFAIDGDAGGSVHYSLDNGK